MTFKDMGRDKAGIYICEADNGFGSPAREEFEVDIMCRFSLLVLSLCKFGTDVILNYFEAAFQYTPIG